SATGISSLDMQPGPEGKDASIRDKDKNNGASPVLEVKDDRNALIQFDLSGLPQGAIVTDARLALYLENASSFIDGVFKLHRLTRDWVEGDMDDAEPPPGGGVTYDKYDGTNEWTTEGGDYDAAVISSITLRDESPGWKEWVVTDQIQAWHDGESNFGFILVHDKDASGSNADVEFTSSDGAADFAPRLTITYAGCECGKDCGGATTNYCDADFEPVLKDFELPWMPGSKEFTGVDFLPADTHIDGVTIPADGGWIMADTGEDEFFVTDSAGATLTSFPVGKSDVRGVAYIRAGLWIDYLAFADDNDDAIYFVDLDGDIQGSITTEFIAEEPFGLTFIGATTGGIYDNHLAFTSEKNVGGKVFIIDQNGSLKKTIDVEAFAPKPQGVAHLPGADKLMVVDLDFTVSIIDFDGNLLRQYSAESWYMNKLHGATIHPETCEHVLIDKDLEFVAGLAPYEPDRLAGPDLLMVVENVNNLTAQEEAKIDLFDSWAYSTSVISDNRNQATYDAAVADNDVVFVGEDAEASQVANKLVAAPIGVVTEEANLSDELGLSTSVGWTSGSSVDIDDNSHYITEPFATGPLQVLNSASSLAYLSGSQTPELQALASAGAGPLLATLEANADRVDSQPSAGRRAQLPWGGNDFVLGNLAEDGTTILQRSLEWAMQPPARCDADYVANAIVAEFDWMPAAGELHGIDYLPGGLVVNSVTVPAGGGWVMADPNQDRLFVTDLAGNALTDFAMLPKDVQGVALIDVGPWFHHFAVADNDKKRLFYLDLDGRLISSLSLVDTVENPFGLAFIASTASATYDNHLAISSDKDITGGGTATVYILDQWGAVMKTIDIEAVAPTPLGVAHVDGADKFIVTDKSGLVSVIDFDGNLLH
ncbi:MAG: DNRLRE domain-containing protein, partial [Gammaproteobacteria bacterium]|nr:DNRLRE domain-containing protein [Gammaproteobacteria bacterium]